MAKKVKKLFAMLLVVCMVMSMLSVVAFAEEVVTENADGTTTTTTTTTTTETGEDGTVTVIVKIEESTVGEGGEVISEKEVTKTATYSDGQDSGDEAGTTVSLDPEEADDGEDGAYQYTVTEEDRTVTVEAGEVTVTEGDDNGKLDSVESSVLPDEYDGKQEVHDELYPDAEDPDKDLFQGGGLSYENQWSMALSFGYIVEETDENGEGTGKYVLDASKLAPSSSYGSSIIDGMTPEYLLIAAGEGVYSDIIFKEVEYELEEDGSVKLDEEGNPVYKLVKMDGNPYVAPMVLWGTDGKPYYAYSVASDGEAWVTSLVTGYVAEELSKSQQFKDDEEAQKHIRGIALHGYWGTADKLGSLNKLKEEMAAAVEGGLVLEVNGVSDKETVLAAIANLTEGDALTATQAAFWAYSNGTEEDVDGELTRVITGEFTQDANGFISMIYQYLLGVTAEDPAQITVDKDSLSLTVGEKIGTEETVVTEDGQTADSVVSDIYDAALNFSLAILPGEKDELNVILRYTDADGKVQTVIKALGTENTDDTIAPDPADGSYTLTGLKLSEDQEYTFDLKLEGTQYLENGVFVYSATHINDGYIAEYLGEEDAPYSSLVSVGDMNRNVDVTASMTLKFNVDEKENITVEGGGVNNNPLGGLVVIPGNSGITKEETTEETIEEEEVPLAGLPEEDVSLEDLLDEEVPLAMAPATGDASLIWAAMSALSGAGLFLTRKKRDEE